MSRYVIHITICNYCGLMKPELASRLIVEEGWKRDERKVNDGYICPRCQEKEVKP